MNTYCDKECKYKGGCNLSEEDTPRCEIDAPDDGLIFGLSWDQIVRRQQRDEE